MFVISTVSVKYKYRNSLVRSRSNLESSGGTTSSTKTITGRALAEPISTIGLPTMSRTNSLENEMKVLFSLDVRSLNLLMLFRSFSESRTSRNALSSTVNNVLSDRLSLLCTSVDISDESSTL